MYIFGAGVALGVATTRRSRRAKEAARAALAAKLTPSVIAADLADAVAELGGAIGSFAADVRQGAANRRASYRPMVDSATGSIAMLAPDQLGPTVPVAPVAIVAAEQPAAASAGPSADQDGRSRRSA
jgi:hypothetical protein